MTKLLLGIAIGYICSDMIDELLGKAQTDVSDKAPAYRPTPPETTS